MKKLVTETLTNNPMTPLRRAGLAKLAQRPESKLDLSDIPEQGDGTWGEAVRNPYRQGSVKQQLAVRLDADVAAWLHATS